MQDVHINNNSISFISPFAYPLLAENNVGSSGGAERQFFLFGKALSKMGWKVSFITDKLNDRFGKSSNLFPVYHSSFSYMGGSKTRILSDWFSLWRAMAKANASYYVLKVPGHLLAPMSVFCKTNKRKLVFWAQMTHDANPHERKGLNRAASLLQDWGLKRADIIIAQSEHQKKGYKDNYGINAQVVPSICDSLNPIDSIEMNPNVDEKEVDILWVGNSLSKKRQEVFFELAKLLPHRTFAIAMNDSDTFRFKKAQKDAKGLSNVRFLGTVQPVEMESWFRRTKLLLNTSIREGFPNTFLQSWINGVPVVSLSVDPDNVISRYTLGVVISTKTDIENLGNNFYRMAQLLLPQTERLLKNGTIRRDIEENARSYVIENHTPNVVVPQLCETLQSIVS